MHKVLMSFRVLICSLSLSLTHPHAHSLSLTHTLAHALSLTHTHPHTLSHTHMLMFSCHTHSHTLSLSFWKWWDASFAVSWEIPSTYLITKAFKWLNHLFPHKNHPIPLLNFLSSLFFLTHILLHACTPTLTHALSHTHSHTCTGTHALSHMHCHTRTLTHTLAHTHSHKHTSSHFISLACS